MNWKNAILTILITFSGWSIHYDSLENKGSLMSNPAFGIEGKSTHNNLNQTYGIIWYSNSHSKPTTLISGSIYNSLDLGLRYGIASGYSDTYIPIILPIYTTSIDNLSFEFGYLPSISKEDFHMLYLATKIEF